MQLISKLRVTTLLMVREVKRKCRGCESHALGTRAFTAVVSPLTYHAKMPSGTRGMNGVAS